MPALVFGLFAVFSLSAAPQPALLEVREPSKLAAAFPARASVRVLNVWATWCVPCVEEMGDLREIAHAFAGNSSVALVGVSLDDAIPGERPVIKQRVIEFLQKKSVRFPMVYYAGNSDALGAYLKFDGEIPITIAFDRDGNELWRHQGKIDRQETIATIRKLLRRNR